MIDGVVLSPRLSFEDDRGRLLRMLRCDDPEFTGFGEVYFSFIGPGSVKAWKLHERMVLNLAVPVGGVRFVIYDGRSDSPTLGEIQIEMLGTDPYRLLQIPPGVWFGFQGVASHESLVTNCASIPHNPSESVSLPPDSPEIPYRWSTPA